MATEPASLSTGRAGDRRLGVERVSDVALAAVAAAGVAATAAAQGGFFPTSWGWAALSFAFVAGLAIVLPERVELTRIELVFLGLIAAYLGWTALSIVWSVGVSSTVDELERGLVYALGALAFLLVARPGRTVPLLAGVLCGLTGICLYGLSGRLFRTELYADPDAGYRLFAPVGYWNGLGLLAAMAFLLALGFAIGSRRTAARAAAGAALPVLAVTAYFTFSRGAWVALALGLLVTLALDPRRLRFLTIGLLLAPAPVAAVVLAWNSPALSDRAATVAAARHEGHRLAIWIVLLCGLAGVSAVAVQVLEARVRVGPTVRRAYATVLVAAVACAVVVGLVVGGGPVQIARHGYDRFVSGSDASTDESDLNRRLLRLSSPQRAQMWRVAAHEFAQHPLVGTGAGTFESYWYERRPTSTTDTREAHSLYLETLAELGVIGLVLLLGMLVAPLAGVRARGKPLVAVALGVYATLLVHAGYDWDWELPAVMLAGTWCGLAALVELRDGESASLRWRGRGVALGVVVVTGAFAFVGLVGNMAAASSTDALESNDLPKAMREARKASAWAPWAARPWALRAQAEAGGGDRAAAAADLRRAIEREPRDFRLWDQLAAVTTGAERQAALSRARELDPKGSRP